MNTRTRILAGLVAGLMLSLSASAALAQVPQSVPVQGYLTDATGTAIDGSLSIQFSVYDAASGSSPLWSESQTIMVADGAFTAHLGAVSPLDLAIFDGSDRWVAIKVGTDAEMTPRLALGTVPYAARAQVAAECDSVPTGSIMFFDLATCPAGWSAFGGLEGRVPVGLGSGGTLGGTVGTALAAGGGRSINQVPSHTHSINPPNRTTTGGGAHTHVIDPPSTNTTLGQGNHSHTGTTGSTGVTLEMSNGGFSTDFVQGAASPGGTFNEPNPADSHNHSISLSGGAHQHSVNIPGFNVSAPNHTHDVDIPAFNSAPTGAASVDVTMPYVQLLACRKD